MVKDDRLLGTAGHKGCSFGCLYCFTRSEDYHRCPRLDVLETRDLVKASFTSKVVQPACDTELLLLPNWRDYLDELVSIGKIISFATKTEFDSEALKFLSHINKILLANKKVLHVGVTIVSLRNWKEIEPRAPSPQKRINSLRRLWDSGIGTTVLIRPLIPIVTVDEIDELVEKTYRFTHGYLSGPLYLTKAIESFLCANKCEFTIIEKKAPWQEGQPLLRVIESPKLEKHLSKSAKSKGRTLFKNNIDAAIYACKASQRMLDGKSKWAPQIRREPVGTVYIIDLRKKEFLMLFHRSLGKWLPPGGHLEGGETPSDAAVREAQEELGVNVKLLDVKGKLAGDGEDFRIIEKTLDPKAFCTIEEIIHPIGAQDPHIHVDSIFVGVIDSQERAQKRDKEEVTAREWFSIADIEKLETFDNVTAICNAVLKSTFSL